MEAALAAAIAAGSRAAQSALAELSRCFAVMERKADARKSAAALLAERAARASDRWRAAFEAAPLGMAKVSLGGRLEEVNPALCAMLGEPRAALVDRRFSAFVYPDDLPVLRGPGNPGRARAAKGAAQAEVRVVCAGGRLRWCEVSSALVRDAGGRAKHVLVHVVDITRHKRSEAALRDLATRDPLSGLANRRWFEFELTRHMRARAEAQTTGALLVIDLDNFKAVNDTLGHDAGDRVVIEVALTLQRHLRDNDLLARVGGDEFAVILRGGNSWAAEAVARKLVLAVRDEVTVAVIGDMVAVGGQADPGTASGVLPAVTVSVGVAPFQALEGKDPAEVLRIADTAMYSVKRSGRNGYAVYGASGPHHARPNRSLDVSPRRPQLAGALRG
ncbi:MAG TPA: sensor domain-containing diguanylate cyclase [Acidimicrobiales bacterium]|nr:sensor domain-containing diguanylate cyclase [Acidimicrobiales bacterium]